MKKFILLFCFSSFAFSAYCQHNVLQGEFKHGKGTKLYLHSFYGLKTVLLDSCTVDQKGKYAFPDRQHYLTGFYRLRSSAEYVDCILEEGKTTVIDFEEKSLTGKTEVKAGFNQLGLSQLKEHKLGVKKQFAELSATTDHPAAFVELLRKDDSISKKIIEVYQGSFFATTANLALKEKTNGKIPDTYQGDTLAYFADHFFDKVDFTNESLTRSTILPNLYMRYLSRYVEYDEKGFKTAADLILGKAKANPVVYNLTLEYLLQVFEEAGPEIIFEYILDKYYLGDACTGMEVSGELKKKIFQYEQLLPGEQAPELVNCIDKNKKNRNLDSLGTPAQNKPILLFFWSTHCQFCQELIHYLQTTAGNNNIFLVGINMDEDEKAWLDLKLESKIPMLNLHTAGGWEAETVRAFMVNKTPTIYLLNENRKIDRKNVSLEEVQKLLQP